MTAAAVAAAAPLAQETVNKLLDFNQKLDIGLLDNVVGTTYGGTGEQQKMAQEVLTTLKEHPDAWTKVDRQTGGSHFSQPAIYSLVFNGSI